MTPSSASGQQPAEGGEAATASAAPGQRATIARYPGANALVISAPPETQRMLGDVITQLDRRRQQVLIEAIVVELSDNAVRELGVQWLLAGEDGNPILATNYTDRAAPLLSVGGALAGRDLDADDPLRDQLASAAVARSSRKGSSSSRSRAASAPPIDSSGAARWE